VRQKGKGDLGKSGIDDFLKQLNNQINSKK
jgi:hypothetical protein